MIYDIICLGGLTLDISIITNEGVLIDNRQDLLRQKLLAFESGAKIKAEKFHYLFGGGAANSAVNFALAGFNVACVGRIGRDLAGRNILDNLKRSKVDLPFISKDEKLPTSRSFILIAGDGERIIFSAKSANQNLIIHKAAKTAISRAAWLYITSLPKSWKKLTKELFALKTVKIAWNPGAEQYKGGLKSIAWFLKRTDVLLLNHDEAIELVMSDPSYHDKGPAFFNNTKKLLPIIYQYGPEIVVITKGKEGADAYDGENFYQQKIVKAKKIVDTTGVGDAFNSSFIAALELKGDLKTALKAAAKNAASKIAHLGAQNGLKDIKKFL
jgi:ribokinase